MQSAHLNLSLDSAYYRDYFLCLQIEGFVLFVSQAVYIAPLKALVRERMDDWKIRFQQKLGRRYEIKGMGHCGF